MAENRTKLSKATSYSEIGAYWDSHDLADHWDQSSEAHFDVVIESSRTYFAVKQALAEKLRALARTRGVSAEALLNDWVAEHVAAESSRE